MALICVLGCGLCGWAAGFILVPGGPAAGGAVAALRGQRAWTRLRKGLDAIAGLAPVSALMSRPAWDDLATAVCGRLGLAGVALSRREAGVAVVLCVVLVGLAGGLVSRSVVGALVVGGVCVIGVQVLQSSRERRRASALAEEMPGIFRTLSVALGSGQTLSQAIDYVGSHEVGPAAGEFARTSLRLRCGIPAERALTQMAGELDAPGVGLLVTALLISQRTGCPLRDLFQRSARLVERQGEFERTLSVKTAQVRLSVRIVCLLPILMIAVLSLVSPDFQSGLATFAGTASVVVALGMDAAALLIIRRLLKGVL